MNAKFGPAGSAESFRTMGYKKTVQMPEYLERMGLDAFEYQCGRGVRITREAAQELGERSREKGITLSLHAPYFISLSSLEEEKGKKALNTSCKAPPLRMRWAQTESWFIRAPVPK